MFLTGFSLFQRENAIDIPGSALTRAIPLYAASNHLLAASSAIMVGIPDDAAQCSWFAVTIGRHLALYQSEYGSSTLLVLIPPF